MTNTERHAIYGCVISQLYDQAQWYAYENLPSAVLDMDDNHFFCVTHELGEDDDCEPSPYRFDVIEHPNKVLASCKSSPADNLEEDVFFEMWEWAKQILHVKEPDTPQPEKSELPVGLIAVCNGSMEVTWYSDEETARTSMMLALTQEYESSSLDEVLYGKVDFSKPDSDFADYWYELNWTADGAYICCHSDSTNWYIVRAGINM